MPRARRAGWPASSTRSPSRSDRRRPRRTQPVGVACHLLALVPSSPARGPQRPPVQAVARYLVTTLGAGAGRRPPPARPGARRRRPTAPDLDLEQVEPPVGLWTALGVPPQPALVVRATVRWPRPEPRAPLVRQPAARRAGAGCARSSASSSRPAATPIARAQLRLPGADGPAWTGPDGAFVLPGVPTSSGPLPVTVTARGVTRTRRRDGAPRPV